MQRLIANSSVRIIFPFLLSAGSFSLTQVAFDKLSQCWAVTNRNVWLIRITDIPRDSVELNHYSNEDKMNYWFSIHSVALKIHLTSVCLQFHVLVKQCFWMNSFDVFELDCKKVSREQTFTEFSHQQLQWLSKGTPINYF